MFDCDLLLLPFVPLPRRGCLLAWLFWWQQWKMFLVHLHFSLQVVNTHSIATVTLYPSDAVRWSETAHQQDQLLHGNMYYLKSVYNLIIVHIVSLLFWWLPEPGFLFVVDVAVWAWHLFTLPCCWLCIVHRDMNSHFIFYRPNSDLLYIIVQGKHMGHQCLLFFSKLFLTWCLTLAAFFYSWTLSIHWRRFCKTFVCNTPSLFYHGQAIRLKCIMPTTMPKPSNTPQLHHKCVHVFFLSSKSCGISL